MPAGLLRQLRPEEIVCPAGVLHGDANVECRVEESLIEGRQNPESIEAFCAGDHTKCPSWRAAREASLRGEKLELEAPPDTHLSRRAEREAAEAERAAFVGGDREHVPLAPMPRMP